LFFNILDFTEVGTDPSDVTIILLIGVVKNVKGGERRSSPKNGAPQPKKRDTRVFHSMPETITSGERDPHHVVTNLDSNYSYRLKQSKTAFIISSLDLPTNLRPIWMLTVLARRMMRD